MWLDRLSAQGTPNSSAAVSRTASPVPRRSLNTQRPALNPRTSSLSLLSNNNSSSVLPASARTKPESQLKNTVDQGLASHVADPIASLTELLAESFDAPLEDDVADGRHGRPTEVVPSIDFGGLGLKEYVEQKESTLKNGGIRVREKTVEEYQRERDKFEELHKSIQSSDEILKSVETNFASFQTDLSSVAAEIETLQSRSSALNAKLEQRRGLESRLGPVVEQIALPPAVVRKISEGPIDDGWITALATLRARTKQSNEGKESVAKTKAWKEMEPLVESLCTRACERIRDHFTARVKALRSPNINAQIIQQQDFLRYKSLFAFLSERQPELSRDVMQAYANTMRWYYSSHFSRYEEALGKLKLHVTDRHDLLGEDAASRAPASSNSKMPGHDPLILGRRLDTIRVPTVSALAASTAEDSKVPTHMETPFLSFNLAVLDNASFEYAFLASFIPQELGSHAAILQYMTLMFGPVFDTGFALTKSLTSESFDALGLLLCVRLAQHFQFVLQRRKNPGLDGYINGILMLMWPRFQSVMDAHCESVKKLTTSLPSRGTTNSALASLTSSASSGGAATSTTAPQPLTQRFAQLLYGILSLSTESRDDEPVSASLSRVRADFDAYLAKRGAAFGAGEKGKRERTRFLSNNHSLIVTILADVSGKLAEETREHYSNEHNSAARSG